MFFKICFFSKQIDFFYFYWLNYYNEVIINLFYSVNNEERGRGQRSVAWLKRSQPCLHHLHVLSTTFSWRPLSSLSLWIILLPSDSPCFVVRSSRFFLRFLQLRLAFVQSYFLIIWGDNLGGTSLRSAMAFLAWVFRLQLHCSKVRQHLGGGAFAGWSDCTWFCIH